MSPSPIRKAYADHPIGQIHYRYALPTTPTDPIPIVFLHKSTSSSKSFEPLMKHYVSKGYRCYAADMPGFGGSFDPDPNPETPYTTTFYVSIYAHLFQKLGLFSNNAKFHIIGHHSGSTLSLEMAVTYPENVKSIIMIGAGLMNEQERAIMKSKFWAPFNEPQLHGSHLMKTWTYLQSGGAAENLELMHDELLDHVRAWRGRTQIYGAVWGSDRQKNFKEVTCPMLAICARDDVLWEYFHYVNELRPEVRSVVVKGANFEEVLDWEGCASAIDEVFDGQA